MSEYSADDIDSVYSELEPDDQYSTPFLDQEDSTIYEAIEYVREDTLKRISKLMLPLKLKGAAGTGTGKMIQRQREKLRNILKKQEERIQSKLNEAPFARLIDKISFTIGVLWSWATMLILAKYPHKMVSWYSCCILVLLPLRFVIYRQKKWHYFLFDFCYLTQILHLLYIYVFFSHESMFRLCFSFANGPLAWAIPLWRNSLVFHNSDKLTSVIIHSFPMLVTFCLRWFPSDNQNVDFIPNLYSDATSGESAVWQFFGRPIIVYSVWQLFYYLKTELSVFRLSSDLSIAKDAEIMTSFKYMEGSSGMIGRMLQKYSSRSRIYWFMFLQFLYVCLTFLPLYVLFNNFYLHLGFICLIISVSLWNGANFYVEVFTSSYRFKKD